MASVSSLDKDLRKLRLDKYTPAAANEVKDWIEGTLGERLPPGDLLDSLKDGVALCRLVNLAVGRPGIKFKQSAMPFVQMENISHFLRACQLPPLNLQQHDMFLTVDLYESKDPTQVLQCLGAFSRAANRVNPSSFPSAIGPRSGRGVLSPQSTGPATPNGNRTRGASNASQASSSMHGRPSSLVPSRTGGDSPGRWSPSKSPSHTGSTSPVNVSSWSKKEHEGGTAPAWNIAQYGYMGGASQGNLGISFGGRRQITSAGPHVPNMADKERRRKEAEAEAERQRQQMEEEEHGRRAQLEAEEEQARLTEELRWEEETRRLREEEKRKVEEEKRRWEEEERQWRLTEEKRRKEEEEEEARLRQERQRPRKKSDVRLRGQYLSQYKAEEEESVSRIKQLEKELELARQREAEYQREREGRSRRQGDGDGDNDDDDKKARARSRSRPPSRQESWSVSDERAFLSKQRSDHQPNGAPAYSSPPPQSSRPLPDPSRAVPPPAKVKTHRTGGDGPPAIPVRKQHTGSRPLPDPKTYASPPQSKQYPSSPQPAADVTPTYAREVGGATAEREAEQRRRVASQQATKAGGLASKSLLEREMELERQRQREWEESQKETAKNAPSGQGVDGVGGRWDVGQWAGYTGGDNQNKGGQGIGAGRRQIVGPRPLPGRP